MHKINRLILKAFCFYGFVSTVVVFSQDVSLEYIFQDTAIVNPRPSLKQISAQAGKIFYFADDDYNGSLSLFSYNYLNSETYRFSDSENTASEFRLMPNGDAIGIMDGDVYVSRDFAGSNKFTKDLQITNSNEYEYSPELAGNFVVYRKSGNYFITRFDTLHKELQLTTEESDSISFQILGISDTFNSGRSVRILFARYDNSPKETYLFPNYINEFVTIDKQKKGVSKVRLIEFEVNPAGKNHTLYYTTRDITYPGAERLSTQYAVYSPNGEFLILDAETLDRHTRKLFRYSVEEKSIIEIYSETDAAWYERHGNATRFADSNLVIFESEVSGFNSLYFINTDGSGFRLAAGGEYTVLESAVDTRERKIYFTANKESPVEYNIYEIEYDGLDAARLTTLTGDYEELSISADGNFLFYKHSYITKPSELYYYNLSDGTEKQITNTINPKFRAIDWVIPELISYNNEEDGQLVYAYLYKPKKSGSRKKHPLICFAHGSGYLQNITKGYSPYGDNFMVNTYLVNQGYMVLDVDFRGSAGYGRDFRTKTYRNLGYWEVSDIINGIKHLEKQGLIDRNKVGIYGGSYGGFVTLMAVFRHADYFKAGIALRAVSNWKNYFYSNWWYTLARLGNYHDNNVDQFYKLSSPITYADKLQVPLLITHGMLDDNVFFQDMAQLTQKLIDCKKDFEVMFYPREYHSFHIQSSWLDQYKRIVKFFDRHIK